MTGDSIGPVMRAARRLARTVHALVVIYLLIGVFGSVFMLAGAGSLLAIAIGILLTAAGLAAAYGLTAPLRLTPLAHRVPAGLLTAALVALVALAVVTLSALLGWFDFDTALIAAAIAGALVPLSLVAVAALLASTKLPTTANIARTSLWGLVTSSLTASVALVAPRLYVQSLLWFGLPFLGFVFFIFGAVRLVTALDRLGDDIERRELGDRFD